MADKQVSREIFEAIMKEMVGTFRPSRDEPADDSFHSTGPSRSTPRSQTKRYDDDFLEVGRYSRADAPLRSPREEYRPRATESRRPAYSAPSRRHMEAERSPPHYFSDPRRSRSPHRSDDYYFNSRSERERDYMHPRESGWSDEREFRRPSRRDEGSFHEDYSRAEPKRGDRRPDNEQTRRESYIARKRGGAAGGQEESGTGRGPQRGGVAARGLQRGGVAARGLQRGGVAARGLQRGGVAARGQRGGVPTRGPQRGAVAGRGLQRGGGVMRGRGAPRGRGNKNQGPTRPGAANGKKPTPKREDKIKELMSGSDALSKLGSKIVRWSGFNKTNSGEFDQKNPAYTSLQTQTFANTLASFKCPLKPELRYQCFLTVKAPNHAALKKPIVDADFLSLLVEKKLVENRKAFSDIINPLDKYLTSFQQCLLKSAHPLLLACNAYELNMKQGFPGAADLSAEYESVVSLCRKSLVLFGQTYSIATSLRQEKILEHVGLQEMAPKPSDFPNLDDSALFGKKYMTQLKAWLEKSGYPMHLQSDQPRKPKDSKEDLTPEPAVKETIDSLLEHAVNSLKEKKKAETTEKDTEGDVADMEEVAEMEKPELWYLFEETSQEFKYYQRKLAELHKHQQAEVEAKRAQLKAAAAVSLAAKSAGPSKASTDPQFAEVDEKTRETAENLARFMIQLGSEIEDFNMDSLTSNPEFWFLTKKESAAHKFYQMKLTEFRESTDSDAKAGEADAKDSEPTNPDGEVTDGEPKEAELNGSEAVESEDSALQDSQVSETQIVEMDSEEVPSQVVTEVECESTESTANSTPATPSQTSLPQRKRGPQKAARTVTPKRALVADESKVDDPVRTGNERQTGRAGLRKKQKLTDEDQGSEEGAVKGSTASGDEDSVTGQQSNEDSCDVTE